MIIYPEGTTIVAAIQRFALAPTIRIGAPRLRWSFGR